MSRSRPRAPREPIEVRRQQVLDAARALYLAGGFQAVNMEAIAREIGVSKPVVYAAYPDVEAVIVALVDREYTSIHKAMSEIADQARSTDDGQQALLTWMMGMFQLIQSEDCVWNVMLLQVNDAPAYLRERVNAGRATLRELLRDAVRIDHHAPTWFGTDDAELAAHAVVALAEHCIRLMLQDPTQFPPERVMSFGLAFANHLTGGR